MDYQENDYGIEDWEDDYILFEEEDWAGLLKLRNERAKKQPSDLYAQQRFAEALNLNKKYKETLDFITPIYKKNYDSGFGISEIMDALLGLGKTENDFDWITIPLILKLDNYSLNLCLEILEGKRKYSRLTDIYVNILMRADYLTFNEEGLAEFLLQNSNLFDIKGDENYFFDIELKMKKKK